MAEVQMLRAFVQQRLTAAAEEIFELFERTIAGYEEKLGRQKTLDAVLTTQVRLDPTDVQLLLVGENKVPPELQEWNPNANHGDPEELQHVKEEQEELRTGHGSEQTEGGQEEAQIAKFTFTAVSVKDEGDDEEQPHSSQRQQTKDMDGGADGGYCGRPLLIRRFDPQPAPINQRSSSHSSEQRIDCMRNWETSPLPSGINSFSNMIDPGCEINKKPQLQQHSEARTGEKPFRCFVCGKRYLRKKTLMDHMRLHSEQKRFSCSVCKKAFTFQSHIMMHMRVHTGEKPFTCTVCGKAFAFNENLRQHMRIHTGEKPFSCKACGKRFTQLPHLKNHKCAGKSSGNV